MTATSNAPLAEYRIEGRVHRLPRVPQCRVCRSEFRVQVETSLVQGETHSAIVQALPEAAELSTRNVAEHWKRGHLPVEDEVFRRVQEDHAKQVGELIRKAVDQRIGELALARSIVERVTERLALGEVEPTMREAIAAAKLLQRYDRIRIERDELRRERDEAQHALARILSVAKSVMPQRSWSTLGREVDADPSLRSFWPAPAS